MADSEVRQRKTTTESTEKTKEPLPDTPAPPKKSDESLIKKMLIRSAAGILMLALFYGSLQLPHRVFAAFIVALQILTWHEVVSVRYNQAKESQSRGHINFNWYFLFVTMMFFYGKASLTFLVASNFHPSVSHFARSLHDNFKVILFTFYLIGIIMFVLSLRGGKTLRYQIGQLAWSVLSLALIVGQTNFSMSYLLDGYVWIILPHGLIIFNDVAAYFFGLCFGRKFIDRPLTALSPNKTWEGFLGAMISTIFMAFFASPLFRQSYWLSCPADQYDPLTQTCTLHPVFSPAVYQLPLTWQHALTDLGISFQEEFTLFPIQIHAVIFALFASLIAPLGGFLASGIKRAFNKKDYDNIIPGHGGFMDRFDCQLLMSTFVYIYLNTFIKTAGVGSGVVGVDTIAAQIAQLGRDDQFKILRIVTDLVNN